MADALSFDPHCKHKVGLVTCVVLPISTVACALLLRVLLSSFLEDRSTFTLFTLAVMVSARFGWLLCGRIATGLSVLAGGIMLLGPAPNRTEQREDAIEIALFVF